MNGITQYKQKVFRQDYCAAAILAGGANSRMQGRNKAFLEVQDRPIFEHLTERLSVYFSEIIIISNNPGEYLPYDYPVYSDLYPERCSLNGVHSALSYCSSPHVLLVPCDLPFLQNAMVELLLAEQDPKYDIVIPQTRAGLEPLCAIYSKRCLKPAARMLENNSLSIRSFFSQVRIKTVPETTLRAADPLLVSFMNVNTPQDLEKARTREA